MTSMRILVETGMKWSSVVDGEDDGGGNDVLACLSLICKNWQADKHQGILAKLAHETDWREAQRSGLATVGVVTVALQTLPWKMTMLGRLRWLEVVLVCSTNVL